MHDPTTDLMRALSEEIDGLDDFADVMGERSAQAEAAGEFGWADAFAAHAHLQRVNIMGLRARLGALVEAHGPLHLG